MQCSAAQCSAVEWSGVECSAVQYSARMVLVAFSVVYVVFGGRAG